MIGESKVELFYINGELSHAFIQEDLATEKNIKGIFGPSNIRWEKVVNFTTPLEHSHKKAKRSEKAIEFMLGNGYEILEQKPIQDEIFNQWYELYKENINKKEVGVLHLNENWLTESESSKNSTGIFFRKEGKIIAGVVLIPFSDGKSFQCAYRAHVYEKIKDSSISEILEYLIDKFAIENQFKLITRGTDSNLYGIQLKTSLNDFKKQYGFKATPLDSKGHYYPRYLIFFKSYEQVVTYTYGENRTLEEKVLNQDDIKEFTYDLSILN